MSEWTDRYKYSEENVNAHIPQVGGVYRLLYHSENKYYVFYVGQTDNLKRRLFEHINTSEPDECIKKHIVNHSCYFRYLEVNSQPERDRIEGQQINEYNPSCNG